ncbi:hypothetical protein BGZ76_004129, partial [Entomortierella beljakovae]
TPLIDMNTESSTSGSAGSQSPEGDLPVQVTTTQSVAADAKVTRPELGYDALYRHPVSEESLPVAAKYWVLKDKGSRDETVQDFGHELAQDDTLRWHAKGARNPNGTRKSFGNAPL